MKKIGLLLLGALVLGVTSCADETSQGVPQKNPQEAKMKAEDLVIENRLADAYDIPALTAAQTENVVIGKITECKNMPAGFQLDFEFLLGKDAEFSRAAEVPVTVAEDSTIVVKVADLEAAFVNVLGKSAKTKQAFFKANVYAVKDLSVVRYNALYLEGSANITPIDLGIELENAYYILVDQRKNNCIALNHSALTVDEDPVFTYTHDFTIKETSKGWSWRIIPASVYDAAGTLITTFPAVKDAVFGTPEGEESLLAGILRGQEVSADGDVTYTPATGSLTTPGVYVFTINMESQTYEFVPLFKLLYLPGSSSISDATGRIFSTDGIYYSGLARLGSKFNIADSYDYGSANIFGLGAEDGSIALGGAEITTGKTGFYFVSVDMAAMKYTLVAVSDLAIVGTLNEWGEAGKVELSHSSDFKTWTATVDFAAGDKFKIRANDAWDINLGGSFDNLSFGGADMLVEEGGTYKVTLNLGTLPYSITLEKQ